MIKRLKQNSGNPHFKKLSELLEALRDKAELGFITSIDFVKELCKLAREVLQAEKEFEAELLEKAHKQH